MKIKCAALALAMLALTVLPISGEADTGGVAFYGPGWDWMSLCLTHQSWGESVGCTPADYWCVKPGYIPGQWLTVYAGGASIECEIGDTVQDYDVESWLSHNVIELSWEAFTALGMPTSASVGEGGYVEPEPEPAAVTEACFESTGHCVSQGFFTFWSEHGGIPIFGMPISDEVIESGVPTQYFERAVFTWHPENAAPWNVLLRRVGVDALQRVPKEVIQ